MRSVGHNNMGPFLVIGLMACVVLVVLLSIFLGFLITQDNPYMIGQPHVNETLNSSVELRREFDVNPRPDATPTSIVK